MNYTPHRARRRERYGERGAALVEAAIVFIPLCVIVFGIIEYGFIFKDSLTLSSASRAGARAASALPKSASMPGEAMAATAKAATATNFVSGVDKMWVYKANASGDPEGSSSADPCPTATCLEYTYSSGTTWTGPTGGWDPTTVNACLGDPNMDSVGVRLTQNHKAITGWFANMLLKEKTVMRFEPDEACNP